MTNDKILIILIAALLLFNGLAADSLWGDEIFTAIFAAKTPMETIAFTASDIHPPLYYLVVGLLSHTRVWPSGPPTAVSDWLWRWPSALVGVLAVAITYKLGATVHSKRVGVGAALLLALAPIALKYGQEARMHALFSMFSVLSTLCLALALKTQHRKFWVGYGLTTVLNLYTMYFAFIIVAAQGGWVLGEWFFSLKRARRSSLKPFQKQDTAPLNSPKGGTFKASPSLGNTSETSPPLEKTSETSPPLGNTSETSPSLGGIEGGQNLSLLTHLSLTQSPLIPWLITITVAFIAYLPWWPTLIKIITFRAKVGAVEGGVGNAWAFLPKVIESIGPFGGGAWLFFILYLVGLAVAWGYYKHLKPLTILGFLWVTLPALLPIILGDSRALHLRYAFVLPVYLIFVTIAIQWLAEILLKRGLSKYPSEHVKQLIDEYAQHKKDTKNTMLKDSQLKKMSNQLALSLFSLLMVILLLLSLGGIIIVYQQPKPNWRGAAAFVAANAGPGDIVVAGPLWDDTRFFSYYYPQPEKVIPPPTLAFRLPGIAADMAEVEGRLWLITRYTPNEMKHFRPHEFYGVTVLEQTQLEYDPVRIIDIGANLCKQAAKSAETWAKAMEEDGVLNPDPRSSRAAAYLCQGDTYAVVGDYERALKPYQKMVESFPSWSGGYVTLAKTYLAVDNLPAALEAYAEAIRFNPAWQGSQADEAARLTTEGNLEEAAAIYQTIIDN